MCVCVCEYFHVTCVLLHTYISIVYDRKTVALPHKFCSELRQQKKTSKMSRDEATKYKNEGNAAFKKKQWNEAIAAYTKAAEKDPSWEVPYSNRSQVYVEFHFYFILSDRSFLLILSLSHSSSNTQDVTFTHTQTKANTHTQTHITGSTWRNSTIKPTRTVCRRWR